MLTRTGGRISMLPHVFATQHVVDFFTLQMGARSHLFISGLVRFDLFQRENGIGEQTCLVMGNS